MAGRRGWGEDSIYFDHSGECRDPETHRHCPGRWRGVVSLKPGPEGRRRRKKVSGKTKTEVRAKLAELHDELNDGVVTNASYTVAHAIEDWLADGLVGRAPKTVTALWGCPRWRWKRSVSIYSGRKLRGNGQAFSGTTTGSSSLQRSGRGSMRRMCAGRSGRSAGERASARCGRRASCATHCLSAV